MLERETRLFIDAKLKKAGWDVNDHRQVFTEFPITKD
jgi:type I site-specific restriction endonuclease